MALQANKTYEGEIISAATIESQNTGSPGIQIGIQTEDGAIDHTWWLSEKTVQRVEQTLLRLGVSEDDIRSRYFFSSPDMVLIGKQVSFNTIEEEYNGRSRVRVQWVNPPKPKTSLSAADRAASLFGVSVPSDHDNAAADDSVDTPF